MGALLQSNLTPIQHFLNLTIIMLMHITGL